MLSSQIVLTRAAAHNWGGLEEVPSRVMATLECSPPRAESASGWKQLDRLHNERHARSLRNVGARSDSSRLFSNADGKLRSLRYVAADVAVG